MKGWILLSAILAGPGFPHRAQANFNAANSGGLTPVPFLGGTAGGQIPILGELGGGGVFETSNLPMLMGGNLSLPEVPTLASPVPEGYLTLLNLPAPEAVAEWEVLPGFYKFWVRVVGRVGDKIEGTLSHTTGFLSETAIYTIERTAQDGTLRRVRVYHLYVKSRRPGTIDDYQKWWVVFERQTPPGELPSIFEADEMGSPTRGDPKGLSEEFQWWKENLEKPTP